MIDHSHLSINEAFVADLFDSAQDTAPMTVELAAEDLERFRADGWDVPEDLTAEEYVEIWNRFAGAETPVASTPKYDLIINSHGHASPISYGYLDKVADMVGIPKEKREYVIIGKYRIDALEADKPAIRSFLDRAEKAGKLY